MGKPLKIGHRGAKNHVTENTLKSIQKALDFKVDGIEIDVHKCASGELVVFHDFTLDRMTNGSGEIGAYTLTELKKLKVDGLYTIPTLEEVLDLVNRACFLNIELKGKDTALETSRIIESYTSDRGWNYDDFLISSFQHQELETMYQLNKKLRLGVLTKANVSDASAFGSAIQAYAIHPNIALVTSSNVALAQERGFRVMVWTVNDPNAISRMMSYGVDGIISDNPERL